MTETYVITGANRGLGLEFARQLSGRGSEVIATARSPEEASDLQSLGVRVEALEVSRQDSVGEFARHLGDEPIDVLINNAAVGGGGWGLPELDLGHVARCLAVNSLGPLRMAQALLPNLRAGRRKLIVNITSKMGSLELNTSGGYYGYRASKAALNMLNRSLARELGREGFVCIVLHPGWVQTDMGSRGAPLTPKESVAGMLRVLDGLSPEDNGRFLDFGGNRLPW